MKKIFLYIALLWFLFSCSSQDTLEQNEWAWEIKKRETILALWDSLTAGYWVEESENYPSKLQKKLDEAGYNYKVINAWVSWDTSLNLLSRASLYLEKEPQIVILVIWGNDGLRGLSTSDLKQNILQIIDTFPKSKIVLWWMDIPANLWIAYRNEFKKIYKEIASERKEIYFLEYFLTSVGWKPQYNISDMIHPNSSGYEIIVKNLMDFLEENKIIE